MTKLALGAILILFAAGAAFAPAAGPQTVSTNDDQAPELQSPSGPCVKIAVIDSQKALEQSTEGQKLLAKADKLSKKKLEEELGRIRTEMVDVVDKIAREKGYGLVLDKQTAGIIKFLPPVDDLTDELIKRYNSLIR